MIILLVIISFALYFSGDSCSQICETGDEDESDQESGRPMSLFEVTDYARVCDNPNLFATSDDQNIRELAKIHALYRSLAGQSSHLNNEDATQLQPSSLVEILSTSRDSLTETVQKPEAEYESICSDFDLKPPSVCPECNKDKSDQLEGQPFTNDSSPCNDKCTCDITCELPPYVASSLYAIPQRTLNSSKSSLSKNHSEINYNILSDYNTIEKKDQNSSLNDITSNDRVPSNGHHVPDFIEDDDANVILCNPVQYDFHMNNSSSNEKIENSADVCQSDNDSDCVSNISEDSEYMIRTSKLSKFLCVGVGRTKSKAPYKVAKQNFKNDSKKNVKMKETKIKSSSKSRDSSKSPEFNSKNLLKSPSRASSQSMSKNRSCVGSTSGSIRKNDFLSGSGAAKSNKWSKFSSSKSPCDYSTNSSFSYQANPGEGYDSGHDSGMTQGSSTPQDVPDAWALSSGKKSSKEIPKLPLPSSKSGTSSSTGTTPSLGDSSGYGSMARDSECSSFSSSQDSEMDEEHRKVLFKLRTNFRAPPVKLENFTEEDILRYEGRSRNTGTFGKHL